MALNLVTNVTRQEPPELFDRSIRKRCHAVRNQKLLELEENKILAEQESLEEEQHYETCAALQLIKLGIKTASWECTAMGWQPLVEAKRSTLELGVSSQVCCSFRGVATS